MVFLAYFSSDKYFGTFVLLLLIIYHISATEQLHFFCKIFGVEICYIIQRKIQKSAKIFV